MTAYIICDNDTTLHVVVGNDQDKAADDQYAEKVKKKLQDQKMERCKKDYGEGWEDMFAPRFYHIHRVTCEEAS